jgi:Mg-chelatase subunit ChlI
LDSTYTDLNPSDTDLSSFNMDGYLPMSVTHQMRGAILHRIKTGLPVLPEIDGRDESKADVIRTLLSGAHLYLVSEEGTGKTRLAKSLTSLLPAIPVIRGCPYNDDPLWSHDKLCPRCRSVKDPATEFGIDLMPNTKRFSRIQGNEYTNEAKLLGLKDIQSIAHGKSLSDPEVFTGTGVFRANRGILFVDEMPAIRTKIQVLVHPVLEEKQAVLEEYNWQYPLDLIFVATGNPTGYSHVNDIPRPLLDRLEVVYMDMPDEDVEKKIMLEEGFNEFNDSLAVTIPDQPQLYTQEDIVRTAMAPWWIVDMVNKAVRHSRICPYVEKRPSIRASIRALEHTISSVEIENRMVANLRHAFYGIRLALRGRIGLRADLIDFEQPNKAFILADKLSEDFLWNAFENICRGQPFMGDWDRKQAVDEISGLMTGTVDFSSGRLPDLSFAGLPVLSDVVQRMKTRGVEQHDVELPDRNTAGLYTTDEPQVREELNFSALEMIGSILVHEKVISEMKLKQLFFAGEYTT